jgi:hypothetical protein
MNIHQLRKQVGTNLRLRPIPNRVAQNGTQMPVSDDLWQLEALLERPPRIRLVNLPTGHFIELQPDNIREYRSPDFLLLRCQLTIEGPTVHLEPIHAFNETFARLEKQMPALLDEMRKDLAAHPLRREVVFLKRCWSYSGKGNELIYYLDDHPDLLSQFQIIANNGLAAEITYNNVTRYQIGEKLASYLGA